MNDAYQQAFKDRREIMHAARTLNAYHFACFVGERLRPGTRYRGLPKGTVVEHLLCAAPPVPAPDVLEMVRNVVGNGEHVG